MTAPDETNRATRSAAVLPLEGRASAALPRAPVALSAVQRAGEIAEVSVTLGRRAPPLTEVLAGVQAGEAVLVPPAGSAP